ncbi:P-selectin-like [Dysidea avara]|uniref:P-selectin-like n=1 Tax=Dysidea avara TaxID=196820 RepID=UPI00332F62DE
MPNNVPREPMPMPADAATASKVDNIAVCTEHEALGWGSLSCGHSCIDNPEVNQRGTDKINSGRQVIVPSARINCTGRITGIAVSMDFVGVFTNDFPMIQVWRPSSPGSSVYNNISQVELSMGISVGLPAYFYINVSTNVSMDFQSDDVIGYYQPPQPRRVIWNIQTSGYTSYSNNVNSSGTTIDINNVDNVETNRQPLIELQFDIRCENLSTPSNGEITSCSTGREGMGYEGDTCSFTCNTGYELTGSDTRTCQSDGSWSGSDDVCRRVHCPSLTSLNGMYRCNLGGDGVTSYEDICHLVCNTGYELISSDTRTCQSDGSWSGTINTCSRVHCPSLTDPNNGTITCSLGDDGVPSYEDTCSFTCNTGYELTSSDTRTCQSYGSWSSSDDVCRRVQCPPLTNGTLQCTNGTTTGVFEDTCTFSCNGGYELQGPNSGTCLADQSWSGGGPICVVLNCSTSPPLDNSQLQLPCDTQYQSTCVASCNEGYTRNTVTSVTYLCNVTSDPTMVDWVPIGGVDVMCERVQCPLLTNGSLQCPNGTSIGLLEDTCTFSCNGGYELQGSNSGTCLANQSWSGGLPSCVPLNCTTSTLPDGVIPSPSCSLVYQSQCTLSCDEGFTGDDVTYLCNVTSDPTMVDWVIGGVEVMCERVQCPPLTNGTLQCPNKTTTGVFEDTCTFSCNGGYELQGSNNGTCLADQSWSGGDPICVVLNCSTSSPLDNSQLQLPCDSQYQSTCTTVCVDGYTGAGGSYTCDVTDVDNTVGWRGTTSCQRVNCSSLTDPNNGMMTCSLGDDEVPSYEDTCSFTCNTGYELSDTDTRTCQSDGSWSGSDDVCRRGVNGSSEGSYGAAIGGAVGGIVGFVSIATVVLLVLLYVRRSHQNKSYPIKTNPTSNGGDKKTKEEQYSEIVLLQLHREDTIRMNNPSYELYTSSDVAIQPNPSYGVNKPNSKIAEDQYEYVQPMATEFTKHPSQHNREDDVNMESNPSYGVIKGEGNSNMGCDVIIKPNPSYEVAKRMGTNTKTTPGSDVAIAPNPAYDKSKPQIADYYDDDDDYILSTK